MHYLSEDRVNKCQILGRFGFFNNRIITEFWVSAHPYLLLFDPKKDETYINDSTALWKTFNYRTDICSLNKFCLHT